MVLFVSVSPCLSQSGNRKAESTLTVMTWNLEWFFDDKAGDNYSDLAKEHTIPSRTQWEWKRDAVADSIAKAQPTILAVQEVENRRVLWYLAGALKRNHKLEYHELGLEGRDFFTEQDVGMLYRPPVDSLSLALGSYPLRLRSTNQYFDVSKHLLGVFEFQQGDTIEQVTVLNVHFRAKEEAEPMRQRQARLARWWVADAIKAGENVIVLGDFNTEERGDTTRPQSDMGILSGAETPERNDDLVDLNLKLPADARQTHLLPGRQFDRIFCSQSLLDDDPSQPDLVFQNIEVKRQLSIQGQPDTAQEHWESYWKLSDSERDVSDHYPVLATFEMR
jgi:endonuclease/exonuclease/phosphatase family metal-dependent hydrolase